MPTLIKDTQFHELAAYYNKEGRVAAYDLLRSQYGVKHPGMVFSRIKKSGSFSYDAAADKFNLDSGQLSGDDLFLGLDALCNAASHPSPGTAHADFVGSRSAAMEKLVHDLLSDRLLALSHYITLDTVNRAVYVDQTALQADGYRVITH